jgi:hypothetical protein
VTMEFLSQGVPDVECCRLDESLETLDPYRNCPQGENRVPTRLICRGSPDRDLAFLGTYLASSSGTPSLFADPLIRSALYSDRKWTLSFFQCPVVGIRSN